MIFVAKGCGIMRLIDADALKEYIDCGHLRPPTELCFSEIDVIRMLDKQPTVDAEPVRNGSWEIVTVSTSNPYESEIEEKCSLCGRFVQRYGTQPQDNYCPNCGARMDGGETDD